MGKDKCFVSLFTLLIFDSIPSDIDTKYEFTNDCLSSVFRPYFLHSDATCNILVCRSIIDSVEWTLSLSLQK